MPEKGGGQPMRNFLYALLTELARVLIILTLIYAVYILRKHGYL